MYRPERRGLFKQNNAYDTAIVASTKTKKKQTIVLMKAAVYLCHLNITYNTVVWSLFNSNAHYWNCPLKSDLRNRAQTIKK